MNLVDCLYALNKWWITGKVDNAFLFKRIRSEFSGFVRNFGNESIITVTGPRGCGKTALFYHSVDYLLKLNTPPARVIMFSGDEPSLFAGSVGLHETLKAYATALLHEDIENLTAPVYVFIDEVHKLKNWRPVINRFHEKNSKLKFTICAPTKSMLFPQADELSSRCVDIFIPPLSLQQFVEFHGAYMSTGFDNITFKSLMPRRALLDNPREYVNSLLGNIHSLTAFRAEKIELFNEYILAGGYPGYFGCESLSAWHNKLFEQTIDLGLYGDILSNFNIKSPEKLKKLLYLIACENGREQAYAQIGGELSLNTVTVINHLNLLSENGLTCVCENYSGKKFGVSRKNKRVYLRDSGIKNALLRREELNPSELEDELKNILISMGSDYAQKNGCSLCFWRSSQSEADMVLNKGFTLLPVSVILKSNISKRDIRGLNTFGKTYFNRDSVVITRDYLQIENNIYFVPYWLI